MAPTLLAAVGVAAAVTLPGNGGHSAWHGNNWHGHNHNHFHDDHFALRLQ